MGNERWRGEERRRQESGEREAVKSRRQERRGKLNYSKVRERHKTQCRKTERD